MRNLKLFTDEKVRAGEREFTRLIGGFGDDKPMFLIFQASELLGLGSRDITRNFERNEGNFEKDVDYIDLKMAVPEKDSEINVDTTTFLKEVGYSQNKLNATKRWLAFSFSGMMKLVKIATTKESWKIYDKFLEDYFKTKAENKVLKATLKEQIENMYEQYDLLYGKAMRKGDKELFAEASKINNKIIELEKQLSEELTIEKYKIYEDKYKKFMDNNGCFTFEATSKILSTQADNENNTLKIKLNKSSLPKYLRDNKILCKDKLGKSYKNLPRSGYEKYFNTTARDISFTDREGNEQTMSKTQTRVTKDGLDFIYDLLVKESI
ncbi:phage antirepressor KilAC domain-containing protein [Clostridium sp. CTA-6]